MTDNEYASKIYCFVFGTTDDNGDTYTRGVLDTLCKLSNLEQVALESYLRHGRSFKQVGDSLGDLTSDSARRILQRVLLKLRHPSKLNNMSVKLLLEERDRQLAVAALKADELYNQIDELTSGAPINQKTQSALDSRKKSIDEIGFSSRVYNHLLDAGINTVDALLALESLDILIQRKGFGALSILEIVQKMRQNEYTEWADKIES
jgi:hypothetical protein